MGHILLWIECMTVGLLLVVTALAWLGRTKLPRWALICSATAVVLAPLSFFGTLLGGVSWLRWQGIEIGLFNSLLTLVAGFLIGSVGLSVLGLRRRGEGSAEPASADWALRRWAVALLIGFMLVPATFWLLDLAVTRRLAGVRLEAGTLVLDVAPPPLPDKENAALIYQHVIESWGDMNEWPQVWEDATDAIYSGNQQQTEDEEKEVVFDFRAEELADFLAEHAEDLKMLHQAAALPHCRFDRDYERPSMKMMMMPELQGLRAASRLLAVEARRRAALGEMTKSLENVAAMFTLAEHVADEPIVLSVLVGVAFDAMAIRTLEGVLLSGELSEEDLSALEIPMEVTFQSRFLKSFRMEEAMALWIFSELDVQSDWAKYVAQSNLGNPREKLLGFPSFYRVFLLDQDMRYYRKMNSRFRILASEPYHRSKQEWNDLGKLSIEERGSTISSLLLPALTACIDAGVRGDAQHRTAQVAWAMHRYRAEYSEFPKKLSDLAPDTLLMLPLDPFDGKSIKLKRTDDGWVVYSIGPDMKDDGGVPMGLEGRKGDLIFSYHADE